MNQTLKNSSIKAILEEENNWVQDLPAILLQQRATPAQGTRLIPLEVMSGRAMHLPEDIKTGGGELEVGREAVFQCMRDLVYHLRFLKVFNQQQHRDWMNLAEENAPKLPTPRDKVMVQLMTDKKGLGIQLEGPFSEIMTGQACALIDEKYGLRW